MSDYIFLFVLLFIGSIAGLVGGVVFLFSSPLKSFLCKYSVPFAAGVLLAVALMDLVPEAVENLGESAYPLILIAFLCVYIFEKLLFAVHHHEEHSHTVSKGAVPLVILGDTVHNFIDGVAITSAFLVEPTFGFVVALSSLLHEVPHEIGDFGILLSSGWKRAQVFAVNFFSASTTFVGAFFVLFIAGESEQLIGILLALSAGLFLYLGASDFLPKGDHDKSIAGKVIAVLVGASIMIAIGLVFPHAHE